MSARPPLVDLEKRIIREAQGDFPLVPRPYAEMAARAGTDEATFLRTLSAWAESGVVRRVGAHLRHREVGYKANAMSVWEVEEARTADLGAILAERPEVSHCYERPSAPDWPYRVYAMIHGTDREACAAVAEAAAAAAEAKEIRTRRLLLYSTREFKKESLAYF